ncbi:MAG: ABC transporter permease [Firmicutes bacterium]|nr:ABC transporter permease [Bacillota bacterium]
MGIIEFFINNYLDIQRSLLRHIQLVGISVLIGMIISIPLGIFLSRHKRIAGPVLAVAGMIQTIPGLVMLGFALILFGIGLFPALVVLSLYAILPILRNTYTGITEVEPSYIEAGRGIGMTNMQILAKVELPLSLPSIISGIRISTVYIVSWSTLAGLIGAGGLGDLIWTGLSNYNSNYILAGAIPAAILAFLLSGLIGFLQRILTPRGLRGLDND